MDSGHAERLLPMVSDVMRDADIDFDDLEAIAIAFGPGSFTGTRIAISAARAFALSGDCPVLGTTSLALMAAGARAELGGTIDGYQLIVCVDARKDQIYTQFFDTDAKAPTTEPSVGFPDKIAIRPAQRPIVAVGSGATILATAQREYGIDIKVALEDLKPDAKFICDCPLEPQSSPKPLYLRPPDAKRSTQPPIARVNP